MTLFDTTPLSSIKLLFANRDAVSIVQRGLTQGRTCLFIRCGDKIPEILRDNPDTDGVTVVLLCYQTPAFAIHPSWWIIAGGLSKFHAAGLALEHEPCLRDFECFAFFDMDIDMRLPDLIALADQGMSDGCDVFQASVLGHAGTWWGFLRQRPHSRRRPVTFVEVMAPLLSKRVLEEVRSQFGDSISTWGLDYLFWNAARRRGMYVYDQWAMHHGDSVDLAGGPFYRYLAAMGVDPVADKWRLRRRYAGEWFYVERQLPWWTPDWMKPEMLALLFGPMIAGKVWRRLLRAIRSR